MWDGYLGRTTTSKYRIDLLGPTTRPELFASYCAGLKTRESEKTETNKMLRENVIEPAQTGWALPVFFASN